MRPGEAVMELARIGFRFRLDGEAVRVRFEGKQTPDPEAVSPLLDLVRQHKDDVRFFLKCHCPRCGAWPPAPTMKGGPCVWPVIGGSW